MATTVDKTKPYFPVAGATHDGWSTEDEATATCFCGAVQLSFPTQAPGLFANVLCNCSDCHKLSGSMFSTNAIVHTANVKHLRGQDQLKTYSQSQTVLVKDAADHSMTNYFCATCGTLMYRLAGAFPGLTILKTGTVDDFSLHETKLKPALEQFTRDRVAWKEPTAGAKQCALDGLRG